MGKSDCLVDFITPGGVRGLGDREGSNGESRRTGDNEEKEQMIEEDKAGTDTDRMSTSVSVCVHA